MNTHSSTHLVLIPSYNPGEKVYEVVAAARRHWNPVWVVVDGSTDGTAPGLIGMAEADAGLRVIVSPRNCGKGSALLLGIEKALGAGYTHALTMDSDGQHPAPCIPDFMALSHRMPEAMILGKPVFGADAPRLRVRGRKVSNGFANLETLCSGIGDSLYGFRVYPLAALARIMHRRRWMRGFDFDPEAAVRLRWAGVPAINREAPVTYLRPEQGGVSHFRYWRDNALLTWMHTRLLVEFVVRLPGLLVRRWQEPQASDER